jgi:two-component system, chemotaxis family, CheB/CheR fusion protein
VVGIGASAGGLEALEQLFKAMPTNTGMAFVVIQHLSPNHKSIMGSLLAKHTSLAMAEIEDGLTVEADHVYLAPPGKNVALINRTFQLLEPVETRGMALPIDFFFRSMSEEMSEKAICIVLSGTASDGTLGLKEVKGRGGMAMVQAPESARYVGMPRSAIDTGLVDFILPPDEMPSQLLRYVKHPYLVTHEPLAVPEKKSVNHIQKAFAIVRTHTGHDFSNYKKTTILRRMERRMAVNQIEKMEDYLRYLQENPSERTRLFRDLLIGVTSFFRDAEPFKTLQGALPELLRDRDPNRALRVWVAGCSTGEEAYSLAILLQETMEKERKAFDIQVFASDIDSRAIETARDGVYPESISAAVSKERLNRFFGEEDNTYRISKKIRDMIVFSVHNVIKDPPFSRIDLLSCRNLLIYMEGILQKKLLPLFHYALRPNGLLFLGTSESIGEFRDLYETVDAKGKLFRKKEQVVERQAPYHIGHYGATIDYDGDRDKDVKELPDPLDLQQAAERIILDAYAPPGVLVNQNYEIVHFMGQTERYLSPPKGRATFHILKMVRESLKSALTAALHNAFRSGETVRTRGLRLKRGEELQVLDLTVQPVMQKGIGPLMVVVFEEKTPPGESAETGKTPHPEDGNGQTVTGLQQELASTREYLQTLIEEQETSNEELKSTNEELQSVNEELQSTNEELETSKEELQSTNEELMTVNTELQKKVEELSKTNDDMTNLLASTDIATVFLDTGLSVKRFTPQAAKIFHLISTDMGRPLADIASRLKDFPLIREAGNVLDTLKVHQAEVASTEGTVYDLHIRPYRTVDNVIDGVVVTLVDISQRKTAESAVEKARRYAEEIIDTVREALVVLDGDLNVISANRSFYTRFRMTPENTEGRSFYELSEGRWDVPELRRLLEEILPEKNSFENFQMEHEIPGMGRQKLTLNARRIQKTSGKKESFLLAIETA